MSMFDNVVWFITVTDKYLLNEFISHFQILVTVSCNKNTPFKGYMTDFDSVFFSFWKPTSDLALPNMSYCD